VTEVPLFSESMISPCIHPAGGFGALSTVSGIGAAFEWLSKLTNTPIPELSSGAEDRRGKNDTLFFRPSATGTGLLIGGSKGAHITGLTIGHDKYDLALALMEGAAFALRHNLETAQQAGARVDRMISVGGSANSALWTQIKADVTGKPIWVSRSDTATTLGAAMLAGVGCGVYGSYEEAVQVTRRETAAYEPDSEKAKAYDDNYAVYRALYENLKELMRKGADAWKK